MKWRGWLCQLADICREILLLISSETTQCLHIPISFRLRSYYTCYILEAVDTCSATHYSTILLPDCWYHLWPRWFHWALEGIRCCWLGGWWWRPLLHCPGDPSDLHSTYSDITLGWYSYWEAHCTWSAYDYSLAVVWPVAQYLAVINLLL